MLGQSGVAVPSARPAMGSRLWSTDTLLGGLQLAVDGQKQGVYSNRKLSDDEEELSRRLVDPRM